ncbi:MAG: hypothetical protein EOM66_04265 [Clostridia bacterium]|nr:hypothetical protein [Clostridia bacterium]
MPRKTFRGELFDNILLYKQAEFALDQTTKSVEIVFQNIEGGKTMPVDSSGWIATVGKPFMYNNRLHLFDIKRTVIVDESVFSQFSAGQSSVDDPTEPPPTPPPTDAPYTDPPDTEQPSHQIAPSVSTISLSNLRTTAIYATAYLGSTGNSPILEKGFVYSTYNSTPTVTNGTKRIISGASSVGYYYGDAFGLEPDTLYYIRAYAVNAIGIAYGSALSARTTQAPITEEPITNDPITDEPITTEEETTEEETTDEETTQEVTTELPPSYIFVEHYGYSAISPQDAYNQGMGGNIYKDSTTQCYYNDWGTNVAPDGWYLTSYGATFGGSAWMKLEGGYIVATQDTSDETTQEQTTELATTQPPPQPPVVTTISVGSITTVSAVVNSSVTSTKPLIQKGICVSLYQNPTITDMAFQAANTATGAYQVSATGLTPMATYYVRAYAINADGITYGGQLSFETEEEATTEPVPQYLFVEHYGFATDSAQEAWESGMGGNLYLNTTTQRYYDDTGENVAVNGYYITYFGDTFESSEHIQLIGGYQQQ